MSSKKIKIAIFDLTDCEGCELAFLALREKLVRRGHDFEITNWRLANEKNSPGPFDVTFIEGSPITEADIETVKRARAVSKKIIALGTCAVLGGIHSALEEKDRAKDIKDVYGYEYQTNSKSPKPISYYINIDVELAGCPINPAELEKLLTCLFADKEFKPAYAPVCLECKAAGNACILLDEGLCLGPVTKGGCGAPCPSGGVFCRGCFGPMPGADLRALQKSCEGRVSDREFQNTIKLYFKNTNEYKEYITNPKNKES